VRLEIASHLAKGDDVVMLCEGDPFFYGSFMYVFERLSAQFSCVVVPGCDVARGLRRRDWANRCASATTC
jgi:precorrin-2 methylase